MGSQSVELVFNKKSMDEYNREYLETHPRAKKNPIDSVFITTLNKMLITPNRMVANGNKQRYEAYIKWMIEKNELQGLKIMKCDVEVELTFGNKRLHDLDNSQAVLKYIFDASVDAGLLVKDDYFHVESVFTHAKYEKGTEELRIVFKNIKLEE